MTDEPVGLSTRMKAYEGECRFELPRRCYTIVRVDGRAFHTYLRDAERPFDLGFMEAMDKVAEALCKEMDGAVLAYVQSDEISILLTDFNKADTQMWFGGVAAKITSISASLATAVLSEQRPGGRALFDSRVFQVPDRIEAANYFLWRQRDCQRNAVQMYGQSYYSHSAMHGLKVPDILERLATDFSVDWAEDVPAEFRMGRWITRVPEKTLVKIETGSRAGTSFWSDGSTWRSEPAPGFGAVAGNPLFDLIPENTEKELGNAHH